MERFRQTAEVGEARRETDERDGVLALAVAAHDAFLGSSEPRRESRELRTVGRRRRRPGW